MKLIIRLSSLLLITVILGSCKRPDPGTEGKTVFRYNESAGISSLDPAFARDQANIWADNQLFNGLIQLDDSLQPKPCIAHSWEISRDGLEYVFHLRQDVLFHDSESFSNGKGRKVVASDFLFSFNRLVDDATASPGAWIFSQVSRRGHEFAFEAPNDSTFIIRLNQPFPPFLALLSMQYCSVIPKEAVRYFGADFRKHPVGTGPFRFGMWKEGVKLVLLKNLSYFESSKGQPLPFLDAVSVTFIKDKQSAFLEFIKGNLDFISGIDAGYKDELLTKKGELNPKYSGKITLTKSPYLNTEYLGILYDTNNPVMKDNPLKSKLIRQAISFGFDRKQMMQYLRNNIGVPGLHGMVPGGLPWFKQEEITGYGYDPLKSRELLARAGYPGGNGLPPITLSINPSYLDLCKFIQSQLNEIGLNVKIDVSPPATLREMIAQSKISFFRGSWIADYPDAENYLSLFYSGNHCPEGPNYTHYINREFDQYYRHALTVRNDSLRGRIYMQMDQLIMNDAPIVILFYDQVLRFSRSNVSGLNCNPLNLLQLKNVKKHSF